MVTISWPDAALSPNARAHPLQRARVARKAKHEAWGLTVALMGALGVRRGTWGGPIRVTYTFHARQERGRDDDNFVARMKSARDGIAAALGVNDKSFALQPVQWGGRKDGTVDVHLVPETVDLTVRGVIR
jgi:hypothetical protein